MGKIIKRALGRILVLRDGFWFVDIPRTSSSSIRAELGRQFGWAHGKRKVMQKEHAAKQLFSDHLTAVEMRSILGAENWNKLFTFTVVRNPWERMYSLFHYRQKTGDMPSTWSFRDYVEALVHAQPGSQYFSIGAYYRSAADYVLDDKEDLIVDYVARFENRKQDLQDIADKINCPRLGELVIQNAAPRNQHYSQFYDKEMREWIRRRYARDVEMFGYEFEEI